MSEHPASKPLKDLSAADVVALLLPFVPIALVIVVGVMLAKALIAGVIWLVVLS